MINKEKGELAELEFIKEAILHGFRVSIPFGDSQEYDVVTDSAGTFNRVQVKSIYTKDVSKDKYGTKIGKGNRGKHVYVNIDFIAVFVEPESTWYIIPLKDMKGTVNCCLYPHRFQTERRSDSGKYEHYREAWDLLK